MSPIPVIKAVIQGDSVDEINKEKLKDLFDKKIKNLGNIKNNIDIQPMGEPIIIEDKEELKSFKNDESKLKHLDKKKNIIYTIKASNSCNCEEVKEKFLAFKKNMKNVFNTCREDNGNKWQKDSEKYLYVGSCEKDIKNRLMQHFGFRYPKTYALHLNEWWDFEKFGQLKITTYETNPSTRNELQICEDLLWGYLNPILGKQGGNRTT